MLSTNNLDSKLIRNKQQNREKGRLKQQRIIHPRSLIKHSPTQSKL